MIDRRKALVNGFTVVEIAKGVYRVASENRVLPEMGCPDCFSIETPYYWSDEQVGMLVAHDDDCPRWKAAARRPGGGEYELDKKYRSKHGDGRVWTGEEIIKARLSAPIDYYVQERVTQ